MAGCNKEDIDNIDGEKVAVQFSSGNRAFLRTSGDGELWKAGDPIGIYMIKTGQQLDPGTIAENTVNKLYRAVNDGNTTPFTPALNNIIYYPTDGSEVDFIAYYPYNSQIDATNIFSVDITDQSDPARIDVLYSNNAVAKNKHSSTVELGFNHLMSKLTFTLVKENNNLDLSSIGAKLRGLYTTAVINLKNGEVSAVQTGEIDIKQNGSFVPDESYSVIVTPAITGNETLYINTYSSITGPRDYTWTLTNIQFEPGKHYQFNIIFGVTGIKVSNPTIDQWSQDGNPAAEPI